MKEKVTVWSLVQQDRFEEACEYADIEYRQTNDIFHLRNKIKALFHLKRYKEVIDAANISIKERNGETEGDFTDSGIAHWMLGNREEAIKIWQEGEKAIYQDAAGGVGPQAILYFAALKTNNDKLKQSVIKKLGKLLKNRRSVNWPGAIGSFLLEDLTKEELFSAISDIPVLKERQSCQAYFVVAVKELEKGNNSEYYDNLKRSISYGADAYLESIFYIAKGELEKLK